MNEEPTILDATGLRCPLPVLRARKALKELANGSLMDVLSTDEAAPADFEAFCLEAGHTLLNIEQVAHIYQIRLRKGAA